MDPEPARGVPPVSDGDLRVLEDREVDALVARAIAHYERAGVAPPSAEQARRMIAGFDAFLAGAIEVRGRPH